MSLLLTILKWLLLALVLLPIILVAVANDQSIPLHLNPFQPSDPYLTVQAPLYFHWFIFFTLGSLAGAVAVWFGQGRYRRKARAERFEAKKWKVRAEKAEAGNGAGNTDLLPSPQRH